MNDTVTPVPISPVGAFVFGFFLVYGAMSLADDIIDALRSKAATRTRDDMNSFFKAVKVKAEKKVKAKHKTKKS